MHYAAVIVTTVMVYIAVGKWS